MSLPKAALGMALLSAAPAQGLELEVNSMPGVVVRAPQAAILDGRWQLSGLVCRVGFSAGRPRFLRLERVNASGAVIESQQRALLLAPGYRGGCASYSFGLAALAHGDSARLRVMRRR